MALPAPVPRRFDVDPDVAVASTLDKSFYLDPAVWTLAIDRIFARSWQWIGDLRAVGEPGSLAPFELLPGTLGEPLLLARDASRTLRCLSNVCTHRGNLLVTAPCRSAQIRCGYHSRRFNLEGRMTYMPEFQGAIDFPSPRDDLPRVPLAQFKEHGFVSLDPKVPFEAVIGDIASRLAWLPLDQFVPDPARSRDYEFDAHWALYVENYLEGLHIPYIHPGLTRSLDIHRYSYTLHRYANLQLAVARDDEPAFELPPESPDHGQRIAAYYYWVFPNLMLNFYPWGLSMNLVQPLGLARTRVQFRSYVWNASLLDAGAGGALEQVEMEDEAVVQTVQRGLRSRLYTRGRYSPSREQGVHHFHRLVGEFMRDGGLSAGT